MKKMKNSSAGHTSGPTKVDWLRLYYPIASKRTTSAMPKFRKRKLITIWLSILKLTNTNKGCEKDIHDKKSRGRESNCILQRDQASQVLPRFSLQKRGRIHFPQVLDYKKS
jgi:hypothetical protein